MVWAAGTLWASRSAALAPPRAATVVQLLVGGLILLVAGAAVGEAGNFAARIGHREFVAPAGYLVIVDSLVGFALYNWLLRSAPVALVSMYAYAVPVVAYLVGVIVLAEPFHPAVLLGAVAIVAAVAAEVRPGT